MKPITNEIQFFSTSQSEVFVSMCNAIIDNYNQLSGNNTPRLTDKNSLHTGDDTALNALLRKVDNIIFNNGDPLSVLPFLKRICTGKLKMQSQPCDHGLDDYKDCVLGKGHFRWDWKAYTLTDNELKAVRQYVTGKKEKLAVMSENGFKYKDLSIASKLKASGVHAWGDKNMVHNNFWITVTNTTTSETVGFDFFGSYNDYVNKVTELKDNSLLSAFECFISDALSGDMDFDNFCGEFGYDNDSRSAERIYKACQNALSQANQIINQDLYDFSNELREVTGN